MVYINSYAYVYIVEWI